MYQQPWQLQGGPASQAQPQQPGYGAPGFPWQSDAQGLQPGGPAQQQPQQQQSPYAAYYQQQVPQQQVPQQQVPQQHVPQQQVPQQHVPQQQVPQQHVPQQAAGPAPGQAPWGAAIPVQQTSVRQQQQAYYSAAPQVQQQPVAAAAPGMRSWVGTVVQLLPPNYGIVDGDAYYIQPVVVGDIPKVGDRVRCEGVANTEGGAYRWRVTRLELDKQPAAPAGNTVAAAAAAAAALAGAAQGPADMVAAGGAYMHPAYTAGPAQQQQAQQQQQQQQQASRPAPRQAGGGPPRSGSGLGGGGGRINLTEEQRERLTSEKYNVVAPPVAQYSSEVAMATVEMSLRGATAGAQPAAAPAAAGRAAAIFGRDSSGAVLDEQAQKKAHATVAQLGMDPATNPGARLLAKMGFGSVGTGLGRNQQGISAPINPVAVQGSVGLGFDAEAVAEEERKEREARRAAREREREEWLRARDRRRSRSRSRSRSPARRYACTTPKFPTFEGDKGVAAVSKRYKDLYLPSDFVKARPLWLHTCHESDPFPIDEPFSFDIVDPETDKDGKEKDGMQGSDSPPPAAPAPAAAAPVAAAARSGGEAAAAAKPSLTPEEIASGRRWSVRVVLLAGMAPASLCAGPKDAKLWHNPSRRLQFLVLKTGKREYGLVGGAWDPADGGHPASDPSTLVNTAVRTFKAATGVDISGCAHWARFMQHTYLRPGNPSRGEEEHTQHSVVFLVGGSSVAQEDPSAQEALEKAKGAAAEEAAAWGEVEAAEQALKDAEQAAKEASEKVAGKSMGGPGGIDAGVASLEPNSLNVQQLQEELTKRGLDTKWNPLKGKKELVDRLQEYINQKKEELAAEDAEFKAAEESKAAVSAAEKRIREARERHRAARSAAKSAERLLNDPPPPRRLVLRPAGEALDKKGRGLLAGASLEQLLDYSEDDTRETGFEVALFAEAFQEMLQQRFGRAVLRALRVLEASKGASKKEAKESKGEGGRSPTSSKVAKGDKGKEGVGEGQEQEGGGGGEDEDAEMGDGAGSRQQAGEGEGEGKKRTAEEAEGGDGDAACEGEGGKGAKRARTEGGFAAEPSPAATGAAPTGDAAHAETEGGSSAGNPAASGHLENLLTACRFYDRECAGHLLDEDLEEIAYMVADDLSRKRVQSLVDAVVKRGKFSYLEHAGMRVPPAQQEQLEGSSPRSVNTGQQLSSGAAEEKAPLQSQLAAAERARRAADAAKAAAEQKLEEAEAKRAEAQQAAQRAAGELEQAKHRLAEAEAGLAAHSSGVQADAARALEVLNAAEAAAAQLGAQLSLLGGLLGRAAATAETKQE